MKYATLPLILATATATSITYSGDSFSAEYEADAVDVSDYKQVQMKVK